LGTIGTLLFEKLKKMAVTNQKNIKNVSNFKNRHGEKKRFFCQKNTSFIPKKAKKSFQKHLPKRSIKRLVI